MKKKRIVVVCPGRGSYTKETLGYLKNNGDHIREFVQDIDRRRATIGEPTMTELDSADVFKPNLHTKGEHASALIYACAYADYMAINREKFDIVAVTGNSMGWYLTLAFGESLDWAGGFDVVNGMGSMMKDGIVGGQVIYPVCDSEWRFSQERFDVVMKTIDELNAGGVVKVYPSIYLGGYMVIGATKEGCAALLKALPKVDDYPFQLINHAAFHTPILDETSQKAFSLFGSDIFHAPRVPLIDGRGHIWQPYATDLEQLRSYTFGHQVVETYNFTRSITVALKEFSPDHLVLLGPGGSLGGSIGQILIENDWLGLKSKSDFTKRQTENPFLIAMGRPEQRGMML